MGTNLEKLNLNGRWFESGQVIRALEPFIREGRKQKINEMLAVRNCHLSVILEGIYDKGNTYAVARSFEAMGYLKMQHVLDQQKFRKEPNRNDSGAMKWLLHSYSMDTASAIKILKDQGRKLYVSVLGAQKNIEELDWSVPCAVLLGNEHLGASAQAIESADEVFEIPMGGFTQSFNISVAAALIFQFVRMQGHHLGLTIEETKYLKALYYSNSIRQPERILSNYPGVSVELPHNESYSHLR